MKCYSYCLLVAAIAISTACTGAKGYLQRGQKAFDAGKYDEASIDFRNAIRKDPKLGEGYYKLALTNVRLNRRQEAFQALTTAAALMPKDHQVQLAFAELCLQLYQSDQRRPKVLYNNLVKLTSQFAAEDPKAYDTLRFEGYLALLDRKPKEGIPYLQSANKIKPYEVAVAFPLLQALIQEQQIVEAENLAKETIRRHKDFPSTYDELYSYYMAVKRFDQAESILTTKIANNPKNGQYVLDLANFYSAQHKGTQADALIATLLDHKADYVGAYLLAANYYAQAGDWARAGRLLREGASLYPKDKLTYQKDLTNILLAQNDYAEAARVVNEIRREAPEDRDSRRLEALLSLKTNATANLDKAITDLQAVVHESPGDSISRLNLARAYVMKGEFENARKELAECIRVSPRFINAHELLAEVLLRMRQAQPLLSETAIVLAAQPDNQRARLLEALALVGLGRSSEARSKLNQLIKAKPQYTDAQLELGFLNLSEKKYADAQAIFRKLYDSGQGAPRAMEGLVQVLLVRAQPEQALQILQTEAKKPDAPTRVRIELASLASRSGKTSVAVDQLQQAIKQDPRSYEAHVLLGDYFRSTGEFGKAAEMYQTAADIAPKDPGPDLLLAVTQHQAGHKTEAIAAYRDALARQPDNAITLNDLAFYLAENGGNLDEALNMSQQAVKKANAASFSDTLAWIYLKKNQPANAVSILQNLVKKEPNNPVFQYHLGAALAAIGDKPGARAALGAALQRRPDKEEEAKVRELLATIH